MRAKEFLSGTIEPQGPFRVVAYDPETRIISLSNGVKLTLASDVKDVPKPRYNYAFYIDGNVATRMLLLTVDNVITDGNKILLIKRLNNPYAGHWALPGGFIDPGEKPEQAAKRELEEETGLVTDVKMRFIGKFDTPNRDPRMSDTWSYAFYAKLPEQPVSAQDDASDAKWIPIRDIGKLPLAFDHADIIRKAGIKVLQQKSE